MRKRFLQILLSVRHPLASTQRLSLRLVLPNQTLSPFDQQISTAARYLRAFAVWSVHLDDVEQTPAQALLKHQLKGLHTTFRLPGERIDYLERGKLSSDLYAIVWSGGVGYKVQLANLDGVFPVESIAGQLLQVKNSKIVKILFPNVRILTCT